MSFGGFMGIGEDYYPLPWKRVRSNFAGQNLEFYREREFDREGPTGTPHPALIQSPGLWLGLWR